MKRLFLIFWTGISLAFLAAPALIAQEYEADSQAGNILFYMPRGWKRVDNPTATLLVAPITQPQQAFIAFFPAVDMTSNLRAAYDAHWQDFIRDYKVLQATEPISKRADKGYEVVIGGAALADSKGGRWALLLLEAQNGKHAETIAYMSNVASPDLAGTLQEVVGHVLDSIGFAQGAGDARVAEAGKPVPLAKGKGALNGIYRGIAEVHYSAIGPARMEWVYHTFFSDGRFMDGFPEQGMDSLDEDAEIRRNPVGWGSYQLSGGPAGHGKIVFLITDPHDTEPITWDLKAYPDHLQIKDGSFQLLERGDGMKLQGTFRREDYKTLSAGARQGIAFTLDGKFQDEGVFKAASVMVRNPVGNGEDFDDGAPGSGAYRIANYTLELRYSDGRTKRTSIFFEPGAKTGAREFYLNTYKFVRVQ